MMLRRVLSFTISTFLFAAFSASAQVDWKLAAVQCERVAYAAQDAVQANCALEARAACCIVDARYEDALDALERVSMFSLTDFGRYINLCEKVICSSLSGNPEKAAAYQTELSMLQPLDTTGMSAGDMQELRDISSLAQTSLDLQDRFSPMLKTEMGAVLRGLIAPFGHIYTGHGRRGLRYAVYNLSTVAFMLAEILAANYVTGMLGGGIILYKTFYLEEFKVAEWVGEYNEEQRTSAKVSVQNAMAEDLNKTFASKYYRYVRRETGKEAGAEAR